LALRSSRFSRSRALSRSRSSVVTPGLRPWSVSALRTHLRSVSDETPNFIAIEVIAAHCEACSSWCSNTIRTARSRTSCGYLLRRVMAPTSHESEPPRNPGRFNEHLVFPGDDLESVASGWIQVTQDQLTISPASEVAAAAPTIPLDRGRSPIADWFSDNRASVIGALLFTLLVLVISIVAYLSLQGRERSSVVQEVAKLGFQLVAIVIAGTLLKLAIDNSKAWSEAKQAYRDQQRSYIRRLIDASHLVDVARLQILANRSVRTWSLENDNLIKAYVDLRDLQHDVLSMPDQSAPVFVDWNLIRVRLDVMVG